MKTEEKKVRKASLFRAVESTSLYLEGYFVLFSIIAGSTLGFSLMAWILGTANEVHAVWAAVGRSIFVSGVLYLLILALDMRNHPERYAGFGKPDPIR